MFASVEDRRERWRVPPWAVNAVLFGLFLLGLMVGILLGSGKARREWYEWGPLFLIGVMLWRLTAPILHEFRIFLKDRDAL